MSQFQNVQFCPRSRKAKILTGGIHRVFRGLKFKPDAEIGQISADFERGRFEIGSGEKWSMHQYRVVSAWES